MQIIVDQVFLIIVVGVLVFGLVFILWVLRILDGVCGVVKCYKDKVNDVELLVVEMKFVFGVYLGVILVW